jgi:IPTL-CTERM motif
VRVAQVVTDGNRNLHKTENEMNFKRVMLILLAAMLLPGVALAQTTTRATMLVWKNFADGNDETSVKVTLNCFTGLPLTQSQTITDGKSNGVTFVVESFESGKLECNVSEDDVAGYTADFKYCGKDGAFTDGDDGDKGECEIINRPDPVQVIVHKDWVIDGSGGDALDPTYKLTLWCEEPGDKSSQSETCVKNSGGVVEEDEPEYGYGGYPNACKIYLTEKGGAHSSKDLSYTALVIPNWDGGTNCWVDEKVYDSSVEVDNGCEKPYVEVSTAESEEPVYPLHVEIGDADDSNECTITNTVFYEGIPTLSQYGMAIMALLMLGVGFVGFRRFV